MYRRRPHNQSSLTVERPSEPPAALLDCLESALAQLILHIDAQQLLEQEREIQIANAVLAELEIDLTALEQLYGSRSNPDYLAASEEQIRESLDKAKANQHIEKLVRAEIQVRSFKVQHNIDVLAMLLQ